MNQQEARSILGLSNDATLEEAKKKYKQLSKQFHPDINKEPDAEEKFKKINLAYDYIKSGKSDVEENPFSGFNPFHGNPFAGFNPFGQNFNRSKTYQENANNIQLNATLSFKESILGLKKELNFSRKIKCDNCDGQGRYQINNGCSKCNGMGTITKQQGNMIFTQTCDKCGGKTKSQHCDSCNGQGYLSTDAVIQVQIPGGVVSGNILRLQGMGNYVGSFMGSDQYTDAHLHLSVEPSKTLKLEGNDVVSTLELSLYDAVEGCSISVETIDGEKEIIINPKSRHSDEVIIPNLGVNRIGSQRVILDVKYPENINELLKKV